MAESPTSKAEAFLSTQFSEALDDDAGFLTIWTPKRRAIFTKDIAVAAEAAVKFSDGRRDAYFGVGLQRTELKTGRGTAAGVSCIPGLWADIDTAAPHRKRPGLPPCEADAIELLSLTGLAPSLLVSSGYGLHAYWLFREPLLIKDGNDYTEVANLSVRWGNLIKACAASRKWSVDVVSDLARVLRVPGTSNYANQQEPRLVVVSADEPNARYNPCDFDETIEASGIDCNPEPPSKPAAVRPAPSATADAVPTEKLHALITNDTRFAASWNRARMDLTDQSPSGYEMSLACGAAQAEWSDDEILALLLAWRKNHELDAAKLGRPDYVASTIQRARNVAEASRIEAEQEQAKSDLVVAAVTAPPPGIASGGERLELLDFLSGALGVRVRRWLQYGLEPMTASYTMVLETGQLIPIGGVRNVLSQDAMRQALYVAVQHYLPKLQGNEWGAVCRVLASLATVTEDPETGELSEMSEWIDGYLDSQNYSDVPPSADGRREAVILSKPFAEEDGTAMVAGRHFKNYLIASHRMRIDDRDIARRFRLLGFEQVREEVRETGRGRTRLRYWKGRHIRD